MELPTHPLLTLVECNANCLKSMLTHYIDTTVDSQFAFLKNNIVTMIQSGQIGPQQNHTLSTTLPPPTQANTDQSSAQCLNCNDQINIIQDHQNTLQDEVSQVNTINTDDPMIKQEFDEDGENEDREKIDKDNVMHCENCENGICCSARENHDSDDGAENGQNEDEPLESQQNVNAAMKTNQTIIENDILSNQTNPIMGTQPQVNQECLESSSMPIQNSNVAPKDISIYKPIEGQNTQIQTEELDDDYCEDERLNNPDGGDCANGVYDLDHENNNNHLNNEPSETQNFDAALEDNQINQFMISNGIDKTIKNANNELQVNDESDQLHNVRRSNEKNSKKKTRHLIKSRTRQAARSVIDSSTPSSSGIRSSTRKRISKKVFGDDQFDNDVEKHKSEKRKSVQSNERVKKSKPIKIENADGDIDDADDGNGGQEEVKGYLLTQVLTLKLLCTETGCGQTVESRALWRQHMLNDHHKLPHYQLKSNVPLNDRDQTEYPCIEPTCNLICKTHKSLINHWSRYHHSGKYKCPSCLFVANLSFKVQNHFDNTHGSHLCTHCGKKFTRISELKRHERKHTGERPYNCSWDKCESSFKNRGAAVKHVRGMHFNLPKTAKEQNELNIIDSRNAHDYIHKIEHLL